MAGIRHPPDERYFVVKGKLWRLSDPGTEAGESARLVRTLMEARHAVKGAKSAEDRNAELEAHRRVDEAKRALGERGPVWWDDGAPDFNRHAVKNHPYADWYSKQRSD
jgi:hypothetical protein